MTLVSIVHHRHPPGQTHPLGRHTPLGRHPLQADTPWVDIPLADTPSRQTPTWPDTSLGQAHPPGQTPLAENPLARHPQPRGHCSAYWNAFLFTLYFQDKPYPMFQPQLGFAAIINNLHSQVPDTADDVQALRAALETVGFNVKCYDDCNVQVKLYLIT